jgi:8-oxo-dGTP diphosphatase
LASFSTFYEFIIIDSGKIGAVFMSKREYPEFPRVGVGAIAIKDGNVLIVKRATEPNKNLWAIPGGMLELGETLQEGAEREIFEETNVRIRAGKPIFTFDLLERDNEGRVRFHFLIVDMEAEYLAGEIKAASDALDVRWATSKECQILPLTNNTVRMLKELGFMIPSEE